MTPKIFFHTCLVLAHPFVFVGLLVLAAPQSAVALLGFVFAMILLRFLSIVPLVLACRELG